jgi:hypothetical protein
MNDYIIFWCFKLRYLLPIFFLKVQNIYTILILYDRVGRFIIPLDGSPYGKLEAALDPDEHGRGLDMCSINPNFLGLKYRYAYACGAHRPCNFPNTLTKVMFIFIIYIYMLIMDVSKNDIYG